MNFRFGWIVLLISGWLFSVPLVAPAQEICRSPIDTAIDSVRSFVAGRLDEGVTQITLSVGEQSPATDCFTKITVYDTRAMDSFILYLSPDGETVTSELYRLSGTSTEEAAVELQRGELLGFGAIAATGNRSSPVQIVIFSDFECPYCRSLNSAITGLPKREASLVRIVYRAYPLLSHLWAFEAASLAACVGVQSDTAFWTLYDWYYANQSKITGVSLPDDVKALMEKQPDINLAQLATCQRSGQGRRLVNADMSVGHRLGVVSTPTLFINGVKHDGTLSTNELVLAIDHSITQQRQMTAPSKKSQVPQEP